MPQHLAISTDVQHYTLEFRNTRTAMVTFTIPFDRIPSVQLTMEDSGNFPVYKQSVTKTGAKFRVKTKFTGSIEITVVSRGRNV